MIFFEIPILFLASALPFRRLCIFKIGSFFPSESCCALDFDCTCSRRNAGKTMGLVQMIGHALAPSLSQSHCGLGWCFHFVYESCKFHRILDWQLLLPPGPLLPSIAVSLQCAPVGQNPTSSFWLRTLSWTLNNVHMPVPCGNYLFLKLSSCWGIWLGWLRPIQFCCEVSKKKSFCQRQIPCRFYSLMMKSPTTSVTTCTVSFWYFFKACAIISVIPGSHLSGHVKSAGLRY